jgi:hypothetical protein
MVKRKIPSPPPRESNRRTPIVHSIAQRYHGFPEQRAENILTNERGSKKKMEGTA